MATTDALHGAGSEPVGGGQGLSWTLWSKQRPTDSKALYRWRVPARMVCGAMLAPEWSDKLHSVGMGYADNEWFPPGSHWDGYRRTVAKGLEWRFANESETEIKWVGLDLLPCPFTGKPPRIEGHSQWVGALPYQAESLILHSALGTSYRWSVPRLVAIWNSRIATDDDRALAASPGPARAVAAEGEGA